MSKQTDVQGVKIRERVWIEIVDHTQDPPRPVEEIFIENGRIQSRRQLDDPPVVNREPESGL